MGGVLHARQGASGRGVGRFGRGHPVRRPPARRRRVSVSTATVLEYTLDFGRSGRVGEKWSRRCVRPRERERETIDDRIKCAVRGSLTTRSDRVSIALTRPPRARASSKTTLISLSLSRYASLGRGSDRSRKGPISRRQAIADLREAKALRKATSRDHTLLFWKDIDTLKSKDTSDSQGTDDNFQRLRFTLSGLTKRSHLGIESVPPPRERRLSLSQTLSLSLGARRERVSRAVSSPSP